MSAIIRGLSLTRPWSFAFKHGKLIENRSWYPSADLVGCYIALHSAHSWDEDDREFIEGTVQQTEPLVTVPTRNDCPHSVIFAVCRWNGEIALEESGLKVPLHVKAVEPIPGQHKWFFGPYGWVLTDYVELPEPVPCVGGRGLWKLNDRPGVLKEPRPSKRLVPPC